MTVVNNGPETIPEESGESEATTTTTATTTKLGICKAQSQIEQEERKLKKYTLFIVHYMFYQNIFCVHYIWNF